ncbi:YwqG family protein [Hymenobacter sp. GOD-10R]|uniref:YwqG family protein n=1 Tax=Hymenobacter sp. GOD-10R TaxID=3093922 RepID=UPI002D79D88D|nr:YwqG family protein [Hymenobacter sp. GOD-10R]WRQ31140.1 YwqG family protein [Hymenobacter sp. GOD-10R]
MTSLPPQTLDDLQAAAEAEGLGTFWPRLAPYCRPSIRVSPALAAAPLPLGASRLGGVPDLPAAVGWPTWQGRSLSFLVQLNLAELAIYPAAAVLPSAGWLSFFYDAQEQPWGYDPANRGRAVVQYHGPDAVLAPRLLPADLSLEDYTAFPEVALSFAAEMTFPNPWEDEVGITEEELSEEQHEGYWRLLHRHGDGTSRLLGNPDVIQNPMRAQCALVTRGLYHGSTQGLQETQQKLGISDEQVEELKQAATTEWELLLQLDSHEAEANMMWEDLGRLYFWIPREALAQRDFGAVWQVLQCF